MEAAGEGVTLQHPPALLATALPHRGFAVHSCTDIAGRNCIVAFCLVVGGEGNRTRTWVLFGQ